jgi:hypothetical protein
LYDAPPDTGDSWHLALRSVPDGGDRHALLACAANVGRAAYYQLPKAGLSSRWAQVGMFSERFDNGGDSRGQLRDGLGLVLGDETPDVPQSRSR